MVRRRKKKSGSRSDVITSTGEVREQPLEVLPQSQREQAISQAQEQGKLVPQSGQAIAQLDETGQFKDSPQSIAARRQAKAQEEFGADFQELENVGERIPVVEPELIDFRAIAAEASRRGEAWGALTAEGFESMFVEGRTTLLSGVVDAIGRDKVLTAINYGAGKIATFHEFFLESSLGLRHARTEGIQTAATVRQKEEELMADSVNKLNAGVFTFPEAKRQFDRSFTNLRIHEGELKKFTTDVTGEPRREGQDELWEIQRVIEEAQEFYAIELLSAAQNPDPLKLLLVPQKTGETDGTP